MCTVTFLPWRSGYILTHNRDEAPTRSPLGISRISVADGPALFPKDTKAGGAWIMAGPQGRLAFLLNGAFVKHRHEPPYRRSRGLILLDFFTAGQEPAFFSDTVLEGVEPFTLVSKRQDHFFELRWDGRQQHIKNLSVRDALFWCSATLYPPDMQAKRELIFRQWLAQRQKSDPDSKRKPAMLMHLHQTGSVGDPENDYVMNRADRVRTVSITQVAFDTAALQMRYVDLLQAKNVKRCLVGSL